jgi:hypothetical protein
MVSFRRHQTRFDVSRPSTSARMGRTRRCLRTTVACGAGERTSGVRAKGEAMNARKRLFLIEQTFRQYCFGSTRNAAAALSGNTHHNSRLSQVSLLDTSAAGFFFCLRLAQNRARSARKCKAGGRIGRMGRMGAPGVIGVCGMVVGAGYRYRGHYNRRVVFWSLDIDNQVS